MNVCMYRVNFVTYAYSYIDMHAYSKMSVCMCLCMYKRAQGVWLAVPDHELFEVQRLARVRAAKVLDLPPVPHRINHIVALLQRLHRASVYMIGH